MTFTSLTFIIFFVVVFALYWSLQNRTAQNVLLVIASYVFYAWWDWRFCWLMLASSLLDYFVGLGLERANRSSARRALLCAALAGNLGLLGFFKYFNFFTQNLAASANALGWHFDMPTLRVVLPIGISFYTFQTLSYSIDIYRRQMGATRNLIEYLAYVSFFPQLVAGPIERGAHLLPQFSRTRIFDYASAADGCRQMLWGFLKKMVIADNLAPAVDRAFSSPELFDGAQLFSATLFFAVQIYCDFSAYSEIASGAARLFGFNLMRNFANPYFSKSMREFWRRWHISLSTWFKDYVYIPLGGGRVARARKMINVMTTFLLSGFWHGATWNFVAWGAFHGAAVLPEVLRSASGASCPKPAGRWTPVTSAIKMAAVFTWVCIGWILFRSRDLREASMILSKVGSALGPENWFTMYCYGDATLMGRGIFICLIALFGIEWLQREQCHSLAVGHWPAPARWGIYFSAAALILFFGMYRSSPFIYFQF